MASRDAREHRESSSEEQRSLEGCNAGRIQPDWRNGTLDRSARLIALTMLLSGVGPLAVRAQQPRSLEHDVKAVYLLNFAKYVAWPPASFLGDGDPFRLCVLARADFVRSLDVIVAGEKIEGHPVERHIPTTVESARACHMLFVDHESLSRTQALVAAVRDTPVLTVGETMEFLGRGGAIAFVLEDGRVRFDVNVGEAKRGGLTISSRLLRVARRVSSGSQG